MPTFDALFREVLDHPDDDTPRLILGDYLLDQPDAGSHARGEFLHAQCRLAQLPPDHPDRPELEARQAQLLPQYPQRWARPFRRRGAKAWAFGRGLVEGLTLHPAEFDRLAESMWREQPVQRLRLVGGGWLTQPSEDWAGRLLKWRDLERVRALGSRLPLENQLLLSPRLAGLRELNTPVLMTIATLQTAAWTRSLQVLDTRPWVYPYADRQQALLTGNRLPRLHTLRTATLGGVEAVLPQLHELLLQGSNLPAIANLARRVKTSLGTLSLVSCYTNPSTADGLRDLLSLPALAGLRCLDLDHTPLGGALEPLTALLSKGRLVRLRLHHAVNGAEVEMLARSGQLVQLRELAVSGVGPHPTLRSGLHGKVLAEANLRSLASLSLRDYPLGLGDFLELLAAPWIEQLHTLDLRDCGLNTHAVSVIAHRGPWPRLGRLDLRGNVMTKEDQARLRARFGVRVRY